MDRPLGLILLIALLAVSARADLQLTPTVVASPLDGVKIEQLIFKDGDSKITYQAPAGWSYSGSAAQLSLRPPKKPQAEATIISLPLQKPGHFDQESIKKLVEEATALIPQSAQNVKILSQENNPIIIDGKETFLVILNYDLAGQAYSRSVLFLNRGTEQLRFQLTCRAADFQELQAAFFRSQFSWENL